MRTGQFPCDVQPESVSLDILSCPAAEALEDPRSFRLRNWPACVGHVDDGPSGILLSADSNAPSWLVILHRILTQVLEDDLHPAGVGFRYQSRRCVALDHEMHLVTQ